METNLSKIMGWESFGVVGFDLGPLLQGQLRIAKLKSANWSQRFGMVNRHIGNNGLGMFLCDWI